MKKAAPEENCMLQGPNYDPISMRAKTCSTLSERIRYDFLVSIARGHFSGSGYIFKESVEFSGETYLILQ